MNTATVGGKITAALFNSYTGQQQVIPTSVVGGTLSAGGTVAFSGATTVSINGCFTTKYDNYVLVLVVSSSSAAVSITAEMRNAGADFTGANYMSTTQLINSTTPAYTYSVSATEAAICRSNGSGGGGSRIDIQSPMLAAETNLFGQGTDAAYAQQYWGALQTSGTYDGISLFAKFGPTITGTIRIYGYNNG
jgi:hypothetical protein